MAGGLGEPAAVMIPAPVMMLVHGAWPDPQVLPGQVRQQLPAGGPDVDVQLRPRAALCWELHATWLPDQPAVTSRDEVRDAFRTAGRRRP